MSNGHQNIVQQKKIFCHWQDCRAMRDMSELCISEWPHMYVQNVQRETRKVSNMGHNPWGDAHDPTFGIIICILASKYIIDGSCISFLINVS